MNWKISLEQFYCWVEKEEKDMILVEKKLHETDAELEASLKQSFLLSSAQCNMSESSIYIATKLKHYGL
jgi:hypothetical protein